MKIYLANVVIILIATLISVSGKCPHKKQPLTLTQPGIRPNPFSPERKEECKKKGEELRMGDEIGCDETCEGPGKHCSNNMKEYIRCFCPNGKVRIKENGRCIPRSQCPVKMERNGQKSFSKASKNDPFSPERKEECRKKGEVLRLGNEIGCDETCEGPGKHCSNNMKGYIRCFCPNGKVRIKENGRCIPRSQCPSRKGQKYLSKPTDDISPKLIEECRKKGEVARWGESMSCDETCEGRPKVCTMERTLRCFCPRGKVRLNERNGRCIPRSQCPEKMERNGQKYLSKASKTDIPPKLIEECRKKGEVARSGEAEECEETCEGRPSKCILLLTVRCFCPEGKVRIKHGGRCIPPDECQNGQKSFGKVSNKG